VRISGELVSIRVFASQRQKMTGPITADEHSNISHFLKYPPPDVFPQQLPLPLTYQSIAVTLR
jgi:hypothetical protein